MRLLTSREEDIELVSMLKEDISTCLTVTSLIKKSCQQCWPIHSC